MNTVAVTGTFNTSDTGPSRVLEGLSGALADTGLEVYAFTHGDREDHPHPNVHVTRFEKTPQSIPGFLSYFRWIRRRVRELDPDVLHPLEEYPFQADIRTVQWTSDSYERWKHCRDDFRGYGYFAGDIALNVANRIGASRTGTVVASSPETERQMKSYWRMAPDRVIPLGIDANVRTPPSEVSNPPRILVPGRITPKKGQREFLRGLDPNSDEYQVDIVGGVSDEAYWDSIPEWHDHHHGFVSRSNLEEMYHKSDIVAIPSIHENFSLVGLEAIAHGCTVIITHQCGFSRLSEVKSCDGVCVVRNPKQMSKTIAKMVNSSDLEAKKHKSYKLSSGFTWGSIVKSYIQSYNLATGSE